MRITILIALLLVASTSFAVDYWPDQIGATFHYVNGADGYKTVTLLAGSAGGDVRYDWYHYAEGQNCMGWEEYAFDGASVGLAAKMQFCQGWFDPDIWAYAPPITYVNGMMAVGDNWVVVTQGTSFSTVEMTFGLHVEAAETVTVPAGTFDTLKLSVYDFQGFTTRHYWLDRELGVVKDDFWELESWTGIIADEDLAWGDVKALYR